MEKRQQKMNWKQRAAIQMNEKKNTKYQQRMRKKDMQNGESCVA